MIPTQIDTYTLYGILHRVTTVSYTHLCHSCAVVCKQENNVGLGTYYNKVLTVGPSGTYPDLEMYYLPVACQHCDNPECVSCLLYTSRCV